MKKSLKKWGNNLVVNFTKEEEKNYNLKYGDILEIKFTQMKGGKKNE